MIPTQVDLGQVQTDEIKVKTQHGSLWMALTMMAPTRLWLGEVLSTQRDKSLIRQFAHKMRQVARCRPLLITVDGLASCINAFQKAFRSPVPRRGGGRPRLIAWPDITLVQLIKQRSALGLTIQRCLVHGTPQVVHDLVARSQQGGVINTAYIERLNTTFRQRLVWLGPRTRCLARQSQTLHAGMYVVGCFCDVLQSLRVKLWAGTRAHRWVQRTPAIAASLTDHVWSPHDLFWHKIPPPRWQLPKRRGRRSKHTRALIEKRCL